jgi:hypothetical protein
MIRKFLDFLILKETNNNIKNTSVVMSYYETENFINNKLNKFPNYFDNVVYRGLDLHEDYIKVDYTNFIRTSAYSGANYLNLILSNDKRFSEYQKRNKSIICTTELDYASDYGQPFIVIPIEDNPKFSYFKTKDLFDFSTNYKYTPITTQEILCGILYKYYNINLIDSNYNNYKKEVNKFDYNCKIDDEFKQKFISLIKEYFNTLDYNDYFKEFFNNNSINNLSELIDILFFIDDMSKSIHNINFLDIHTIKNESYEIWTETPCILLHINSKLVEKYNII